MEEEERTVKTEVKTERDTQEPLLVRLPVSQCMTEQHSQETEVNPERDAQEPPLARLPDPSWPHYKGTVKFESTDYEACSCNVRRLEFHTDFSSSSSGEASPECTESQSARVAPIVAREGGVLEKEQVLLRPDDFGDNAERTVSGRSKLARRPPRVPRVTSDVQAFENNWLDQYSVPRRTPRKAPVPRLHRPGYSPSYRGNDVSMAESTVGRRRHGTGSSPLPWRDCTSDPAYVQLLEKLNDVCHEVRRLATAVMQLQQRQDGTNQPSPAADRTPTLPQDMVFPIGQLDHMTELEGRLQDADIRNTVTAALALEGGETPSKFLKAVLRKVLAPPLARKYNNHGQKDKLPFKNLTLKRVMFAAVRRTFTNVTEQELDAALASWLTSQRDRQKP
ncbi:uncharacterized protein [Littorina saxatilis]|uniref:DUF4806 domain-containing protein n=1 Tax=Littorina saxatilis TaxID=31220 RepID=A0AAN9B0J9_9CAEN